MTIIPAYGRDYKTKAAAMKDWNDGKDFQDALRGYYLSIRDSETLIKSGHSSISLRYDNKRKQTIFTLQGVGNG